MKLIWYGIFYSFVGFLLEVAFARLTHARKQDRKCLLLLPLCPVYGIGALSILLLPDFIRETPLLLLPAAGLVASAAEYAMSLFYEKCWLVSFWSYHGIRGNLHGRICVPFSLCWGLLGLGLVYGVQPLVETAFAELPAFVVLMMALTVLVDFLVSGVMVHRTGRTETLRWYDAIRNS